MDENEYVNAFFETANEMGYEIETCMRGSAKGKRQIDFGNKKLHEEHIKALFPLVQNKGYEFTTEDFNTVVSGRPCAMKGFREINKRILK
ncbi:hypothetical protein HNV12_12665 [Methanococcoides sp. SA1]|nr:hypothetical protein [Methanococcoides sp. SA1]